ncbi:unnamed protein product [Danaus chrysippus]|uniref:(African queen) hypothetical protein n=1 Tax=Danaus chrysippus TaxID=151541 RepID=A0A8J2VT52_9NEOP|nr:unnamed protein product [Danaus chrysippus]CAG9563661.1 unnamed protein product [Danaus chrysippus]
MDFGDIIVLETEAARRVRDERRIHRRNLEIEILAAVRFYAVGSYQRFVGQDYNIVLAQRTVSKVVKEVSYAIVHRLLNVYIKFPSTAEERRAVASGFQAAHGLPDCLGCIDCTHIAIVTPLNNDANDPPIGYKNRKGNYSINTQFGQLTTNTFLTKDEMMRLVDGRIGKYYLIGDSGYSKQSYMLTPIVPSPPEGSTEYRYNVKISRIRNCVERTNGIIKAIFRCLRKDRVLHYQPQAAALIILSCCTIYNMMHQYRYPLPEPETSTEELTDHTIPTHTATSSSAALRRQQDIIMLIN